MTIERRHTKRTEFRFDVHIGFRRRGFQGTVTNLSREGLFIETRLLTIPTGNLIDLEFSLDGDSWMVSALVVHHRGNGMGVVFRSPQPELESTAQRLLKAPIPTAGRLYPVYPDNRS